MTFHNGESARRRGGKVHYERYLEADKPRYGAIASVVDHAEVIDPTTVKLVTKSQTDSFLELVWEMPIVPPQYIAEVGDEGFEAHPIGSGAYKFVQWSKGDRLVLERKPGLLEWLLRRRTGNLPLHPGGRHPAGRTSGG